MKLDLKERLSPNFNERCNNAKPTMLILHYTGLKTCDDALAKLCDPDEEVSAHYLIDEDGTLYKLVEEEKRAWHAGVSEWEGETDINSHSIGIELVNPGHEWGYRDFPEEQMAMLVKLCSDIMDRHEIAYVLGHEDVASERKQDPGDKFDWDYLARNGIDKICKP